MGVVGDSRMFNFKLLLRVTNAYARRAAFFQVLKFIIISTPFHFLNHRTVYCTYTEYKLYCIVYTAYCINTGWAKKTEPFIKHCHLFIFYSIVMKLNNYLN